MKLVNLVDLIRDAVEQLGVEDLAHTLGTTPENVRAWTEGSGAITPQQIARIAGGVLHETPQVTAWVFLDAIAEDHHDDPVLQRKVRSLQHHLNDNPNLLQMGMYSRPQSTREQ